MTSKQLEKIERFRDFADNLSRSRFYRLGEISPYVSDDDPVYHSLCVVVDELDSILSCYYDR